MNILIALFLCTSLFADNSNKAKDPGLKSYEVYTAYLKHEASFFKAEFSKKCTVLSSASECYAKILKAHPPKTTEAISDTLISLTGITGKATGKAPGQCDPACMSGVALAAYKRYLPVMMKFNVKTLHSSEWKKKNPKAPGALSLVAFDEMIFGQFMQTTITKMEEVFTKNKALAELKELKKIKLKSIFEGSILSNPSISFEMIKAEDAKRLDGASTPEQWAPFATEAAKFRELLLKP